MWLSLIVSGALHGLILLPVILSYAGGPGYALEDVDEEWMSSAIRRDYEYTFVTIISLWPLLCSITYNYLSSRPFLADDDSVHSD